ncbi:MAG: 50S ribosomal protein L28 [Gemmatimonas sp.]
MARRCGITGKNVMRGHNVSHANNKSGRTFMPNLQHASLLSDALGRLVRVRVTTAALRTIEHNGGLDAYLVKARTTKLSPEFQRLKRQIEKKRATA